MKRQFKAALFGSVALAAVAATVPAVAQETSSSIRGTVVDASGAPLTGVDVVILHVPSGTVSTVTTGDSGVFYARGLKVGGPYIVRFPDGAEYHTDDVEGLFLQLGRPANVRIVAARSAAEYEEIQVTARAIQPVVTAIGPSSTYDLSDLEGAPSVSRDIKDVIRQDPRIYIDQAFSDGVQCAGANPRFNSLTVDGVGLNDNFGLNSNGYPTERMPFSFDAIQQVAVELAPFDVEYGAFTACNINAVTKSGTNEFHGSAFFDYTNDSLRGNQLEGDKFTTGDFSEKRYGATLGGPIIKDKLFFFASYEKLEGSQLFDRGPAGSGAAREVGGVSEEQWNEIVRIARDVYGYEVGGLPASLPVTDEKILAKIDWNITDNHRLALTYNYNDGYTIAQSDGDDDELEDSNHYYERGTKLQSYAGSLFSDWSDRFSTELRVAYADVDPRVAPLGGTEFGEVQITTFNDADNDGVRERAVVYLGADDSRHANELNYSTLNLKLAANYQMDDHFFTFGVERVDFDIFNLFIQEAQGEYRFQDINRGGLELTAIEAFEAGRPERVIYENASPSNDPNDAAASFKYAINTVYLQDEWTVADGNLTLTGGVRYDWYSSSDVPRENPNFIARNGFSNATNLDGKGLVMPRFGFSWIATDRIEVHGGAGIYSGGNPNVWVSNNYSNNGITQVEVSARDYDDGVDSPTLFDDPTVTGEGPIYDIPQRLYDGVASGTVNAGVNAIDPDFKIPSQLKVALGTTIDFDAPAGLGDDYRLQLDVLYSKNRNPGLVVDSTLVEIGTAPDGRPMYAAIDKSRPECLEDPVGNIGSCNRWFNSDLILTNSDGGRQIVFSAALSKSYDNGIDWTIAYAHTNSTDVNPMTSSVAFSNFSQFAASERNDPEAARSNYVIPNRFTASFKWEHDFWDDNTTRVNLFGVLNQGRPYSFTFVDMGGSFNSNFTEFGDGVDGSALLYIPTGIDDPLVQFGDDFDTDAFFEYLEENNLMQYAGQIAPRNSNFSNWWGKVDLKIEQEIPAFFEGHKMSAYFVIDNLTNLINDDWGVMYEASFPRAFQVVEASIDRANNQYVYTEFFEREQGRVTRPSLWSIRMGVKYKF
ncbi:TonB-dependent receptor [Kordiimonas gwangyangensis]|uniref:TonB-dependent receptor n=1 Tax=Kordiimonas gwangyangensis TaxID=288022 RepID=UPI000365B83C|nr:TonB-dependent receptor [Kordiimonas gwangyangensis]